MLRKHPRITLTLVGHADARGSDALNDRLSADRAAAVRAFLIANGIAPARIRTSAVGKRQPVAQGNTVTSYAMNRVVLFSHQGLPVLAKPYRYLEDLQVERKR